MIGKISKVNKIITVLFICLFVYLFSCHVNAASPTGADWFQLRTNAVTGGDNTGDGNGNLNYYYVGQSFGTNIEINSGGTTAANIWIDYNSATTTASGLVTGTYFGVWSGQVINSSYRGVNLGRVLSTGYNIPIINSSGTGNFGRLTWTCNQPSAVAYGTSNPEVLDINIGTVGLTTESNISLAGADILDDAEDFQFYCWADTVAPYAKSPNPGNGTTGIAVDANFGFELRDSKNGAGDDSGVGTGVNVATPMGNILVDNGGGAVSFTAYDSYSCSGVWGSNLCNVSLNPPSPSGIAGDTRNWDYNTSYTATVGGFRDLASVNQNQLGDSNGPNIMATSTWTFTTESDTTAPRVSSVTPGRGETGVNVNTNITIDIVDKKTLGGNVSGVGIDISTLKVNVSSPSFPVTTFSQSSAGVTVTAIDFGYRVTINPAVSFGENETVSVSVYDCEDTVGNIMITDNYSFVTFDTGAPYVTDFSPVNDSPIDLNGVITFHIKDNGTGVNLSDTVVYVNGVYYTNTGGAGSVTNNGTRITFASSLNLNGGNYAGDTTGVSGGASDYTLTIDPQADFIDGEAVPILVYSSDTTGNLMERQVFTLLAGAITCNGASFCGSGATWDGSACVASGSGSSFCGANTTWNGSVCVASGGGGGIIINPPCNCATSTCDDAGDDDQDEDDDSQGNDEDSTIKENCPVCEVCDTESINDEAEEVCLTCPTCLPGEQACPACEPTFIQNECQEAVCPNCDGAVTDDQAGETSVGEEETATSTLEDETGLAGALRGLLNALNKIKENLQKLAEKALNSPYVMGAYNYFNSTLAQTISQVVAGAFILLSALQLASMMNSLAQTPLLFTNLFSLPFARRRKKGAGVIYDSAGGQPVPFADISVFSKEGQIVKTMVSDKFGSYDLKMPSGQYRVEVAKKGSRMMSGEEMNNLKTAYNPTYTSSGAQPFGEKGVNQPGIPMKQENASILSKIMGAGKSFKFLDLIFFGGFVYSSFVTLANPTLYNSSVTGIYAVMQLLRSANLAKPAWGAVKNSFGKIQAHTVIKAIDKETGKLIARAITDKKGKYSFILDKGNYELLTESAGNIGKKLLKINKRRIVDTDLTIK